MKTKTLLLLVACVAVTESVAVSSKSAFASATSLSLGVQPYSRNVAGLGTVTTYFTTYDGSSGTPWHDVLPDGSWVFSSEFRPRSGVPGVYEDDYLTVSSIYGAFAHGSVVATLPTEDTDQNGVPDFQQFENSASYPWTGTTTSDAGPIYTMVGVGTKSANSSLILNSYNVYTNGVLVDSVSGLGGPFQYISGSITYFRGAQNSLSLTLASDTQPFSYTGSTTFAVQNIDQIVIPQFTAHRSDGRTLTAYGFTLTRRGTKYAGHFSVNDGNTATTWRDFTEWVFEVTDTNDSDGNGIPDFSDALPTAPVITQQPDSLDAVYRGIATFSASSSSFEPAKFQWFFKDRPIRGATNSSLTLTNLRTAASGSYLLEARNSVGTTRSRTVTLRVLRPVRILAQPRSRSIAARKTLILRTRASGGKPLFYQWLKDGQTITGATSPRLVIPNVGATNSGTYSVSVSNTVSSAASSPAIVIVN